MMHKNLLPLFLLVLLFLAPLASAEDSLKVVYPNGGEEFNFGEQIQIRWDAIPADKKVDLFFSKDGGNAWQNIVNGVNSSPYLWNVPSFNAYDECLVKVEGEKNSGSNGVVVDSLLMHTRVNMLGSGAPFFSLSKSGKYLAVASYYQNNLLFLYDLEKKISFKYEMPFDAGLAIPYRTGSFNRKNENIL